MDEISLNGMQFYAHHGVLAEEAVLGQRFTVDLRLRMDLRPAGTTDDLTRTVNYAAAYSVVRRVVEEERANLLERVAERVAMTILDGYLPIQSVVVTVCKPGVPIAGILDSVCVTIERHRFQEDIRTT